MEKTKIFVPISKSYQLAQTKREVVIEKSWWNGLFQFVLIFSILWNLLAIVLLVFLFSSTKAPAFFFLLPSLMLLIGLPSLYYAIAGYRNKTVFKINQYIFTVRHKPLWWGKPIKWSVDKIQEAFILKKKLKNKLLYDLKLQLHNRKEIALIQSVEEVEALTRLMEKINNLIGTEEVAEP
ncbi:MAG: hypothetical protein ACFB0B_22245 [Thermonemataceae bacterium]